MCCFIDREYTSKKVAELKKKSPYMVGYKVLNKEGKALLHCGHQYGPGTHELGFNVTQDDYDSKTQGFHFYPSLKIAQKNKGTFKSVIVKVLIPVRDIIGLETPGYRKEEQGVANSLFITKEDWLKAGFKIKRTRS